MRLTKTVKDKRILIVDDDESIGMGMSETLKDAGYAAGYVTNGTDAIEALKKGAYSLVFMDMVMPGMNGLETFKRIKGGYAPVGGYPPVGPAAGPIEALPPMVVLFTGFFRDSEKTILEGVREGMIDLYIRKPFFAEEIIQAARRYA